MKAGVGGWAGVGEVRGRPLGQRIKEPIGQSHRGCSEGRVMVEGKTGLASSA